MIYILPTARKGKLIKSRSKKTIVAVDVIMSSTGNLYVAVETC